MISRVRRWAVLAGVLVGGFACSESWAQQWVVEAGAGGAMHEGLSGRVTSQSAILGLRHNGPTWFYLSGGAPLESGGIPWAATGAGGRLTRAVGAFWVGADAAGHGHLYREPTFEKSGTGGTAELLPFAAAAAGPVWLQLHTGVIHHGWSFAGESEARTLHDSGLSATLVLTSETSLRGFGRYARAEEAAYPFAGASLIHLFPGATAWVHAGRWISDAVLDPVWGVGASATVRDLYSLRISLDQETNDPLYWSTPRRLWNIALSRSLGPGLRRRTGAVAPAPPQISTSNVTIRLPVTQSGEGPMVAGDFSDWEPVAMRRTGGEWVATFRLEPGIYRYAFRRPDGSWFVPVNAPGRTDDGFGGESIILVVR